MATGWGAFAGTSIVAGSTLAKSGLGVVVVRLAASMVCDWL